MSVKIIIIIFLSIIMVLVLYMEPFLIKIRLKNNNEHGSARWSTKREIKRNFTKENLNHINKVGFPIYFDKNLKYVWFDNETPHWCYLGSSGSGKSSTSVLPLCSFIANAKIHRSVFITDPKAEIFTKTSKMFKEKGYEVITIDFRTPEKSNKINLLEPCIIEYEQYMSYEKQANNMEVELNKMKKRLSILEQEIQLLKENNDQEEEILSLLKKKLHKLEKSIEQKKREKMDFENDSMFHYAECNRLITSISGMIMNEKNARDPFWNNSARSLLEGIIGLFLEDYKDKKITRNQITLSSIKKFQNSSMTEENAEILKDYINEKPYGSKSKDSLVSILSSSENTYKSITSVFNERMSLFDDVNVENIISSSDFPLDILGRKPTAMYIIVPDEEKMYYNLITIIVGLLYREVTKYANQQENKKVKVEIDWILDEFANCPPLPDMETIISVARSRGLRFHLYIQSFAQLNNVYGRDVAQTILDNCGLAYLKTNTQETAEAISKLLGVQTLEVNSINYSINSLQNNGSKSSSLIGRPLLTADEIKQLHYKTILFPIIGHPIFRDTVFYKKFKIFKEGKIERNTRHLQKLTSTYYTVEDISSQRIKDVDNEDKEMVNQKEKLDILVETLKIELNSVKHNVEFLTENDKVICLIGFYNSLSQIKLGNILSKIDGTKYIFTLNAEENPKSKYEQELEIMIKENNEGE